VDWIHLAQDRDQWQALVKTEIVSCLMKGEEFLQQLRDCQLLKKKSVPWSYLMQITHFILFASRTV
jgi:hypothetical protein